MRSKKALYNIISSLILQIIMIIFGFMTSKLFIKNYGSNVNGLINSITRFLAYITLLDSGFGSVIKSLLYKPISNNDKEKVEKILKSTESFFRKIAYIFFAYIFILCIFLPIRLSYEFDKIFTLSLILIISISTFFEYYLSITYKLFLQARQELYIVNTIKIVILIINFIVTIIFIKMKINVQIIKFTSVLIFLLGTIFQNIYVRKKYEINLKNKKNSYVIKKKWDGLAQHIAYVIHDNTDIIILTLFSTVSEISVYCVYSVIVNSIRNIVKAFSDGMDSSFGNMIAKNEKESLNKSFKVYEDIYFTIATIAFICTFLLIIPFVKLYTNDIIDVNYIRPIFAYLITCDSFLFIIRQPYNSLIIAEGHFKETSIGNYIESILNIFISVLLVFKYGIIGVVLGTTISMFIRTIQFMFHTSKYILNRSLSFTFKRLILIIFEVISVVLLVNIINLGMVSNYGTLIIRAIIVLLISVLIVLPINHIAYRNNVVNVFRIINNLLQKRS